MIFDELDLSQNKRLIAGLDKVIQTIGYDPNKVERNLYRDCVSLKHAQERVSEDALSVLLEYGSRDVATLDCNLYKFNNISFDWLSGALVPSLPIKTKGLGLSGRIWYPPAGYMGWHTNDNNRGYKLYCTHCRESDKSFFRYRNPYTNEIVTSWDKAGWNFRIFRIQEELLWHCVYSETDRISIGYTLL